MKRKTIIIYLLIIMFALSKVSYAVQAGTISLESNHDNVKVGQEFEITVNLQGTKTAAYNFYLNFDNSKVDIVSNPENSNIVNNQIVCVWFDTRGGSGEKSGELQKFKFKAIEAGTITFRIEGEFWDKETELIETNSAEIQIQIEAETEVIEDNPKINTNLEILAIEDALLNPPFDINETNYKTEISSNVQDVKILAVPEDEQATVEIIGKNNLQEGDNLITIIVTGADRTTKKKYEVTAYKRNLEEEKIYEAEIKDNQKKLENIYKVEKLSTEPIEEKKEQTSKESKSNIPIMLIVLVGIVTALLTYIAFIKLR